MAYPASQAVESIERPAKNSSDEDGKSLKKFEGPPPASPKPRSASDSSLYSTMGRTAMEAGNSGLGAEGNEPAMLGMQGLALVQRGIQLLNLAFPENPGLPAVLADIIGRLQTMIPQMAAQSANQGMGLLANMSQMVSPMGMQQPGMMGPGGMPPQPGMAPAGPMGAPPMAGPMGPPPNMPMPGQMPPRPPM